MLDQPVTVNQDITDKQQKSRAKLPASWEWVFDVSKVHIHFVYVEKN